MRCRQSSFSCVSVVSQPLTRGARAHLLFTMLRAVRLIGREKRLRVAQLYQEKQVRIDTSFDYNSSAMATTVKIGIHSKVEVTFCLLVLLPG